MVPAGDTAAAISQEGPIDVPNHAEPNGLIRSPNKQLEVDWRNLLGRCRVIPYRPAPETHLIDPERPLEVPSEEFRSLRTRLNHLQSQQNLHSIVFTSASPAEGKTFSAVNLALAQAQLETPVLLCDLDLRRPRSITCCSANGRPDFSDFLLAEKPLEDCLRRIDGTNLYFLPAGSQVKNPLELLNMRHVRQAPRRFPQDFQLGHLRYSAAAVFGRRQSARHAGGRHRAGGAHRLHHL